MRIFFCFRRKYLSLKRIRDYVFDAEVEKVYNREVNLTQPACIDVLPEARRLADFTVIF
jgi:hypothetical protein